MSSPPTRTLFDSVELPNGTFLSNRLCKAAMEENLCDPGQIPGKRLETLFRRWADGGVGLLLTGNVMIAPDALTGPGAVVLQDDTNLTPFRNWAAAGTSGGGQFWMQINHPGRQVYAAMGEEAVSASGVSVDIPGYSKLFAKPRALTPEEIASIIERFATTAKLAEAAGFTGVQIHAAHGYLISQFLSPLTNLRTDAWGGPLANRARLLFETIREVRNRVSPEFCVSVKLNSADFQKGGFEQSDAKWVVEQLGAFDIDLIELSGGSYESPAMQGLASDNSSARREAYFIDFAQEIAKVAQCPVMVTGGIRKLSTANEAIENDAAGYGVSVLGIARAMAFEPDLPNNWKVGATLEVSIPDVTWKSRALTSLATMAIAKAQLERMSVGKSPNAKLWPVVALISDQVRTRMRTKRYRKWRKANRLV